MRILVVGLGQIAQTHIRNLKAIDPNIEIAVWRQRPDPPGWQPPIGLPVDRYFVSDRTGQVIPMIECWQPNVAIIANPASLHVDNAGWLGHDLGCNLFIEKPLSDCMEWVDQMLDNCRRHIVMVGYDLRFYRPLQLVKQAIDEGRIGRPLSIRCEVGQYLPDWRPGRDYRTSVSARSELGGGVILELSHEIDYARWLMGEVAAVTAQTGRISDLEIDVEDTADILLRFESGAMGNVHLDMTDRAATRYCRVVGTEGSISVDLPGHQAWLFGAHAEAVNLMNHIGSRDDQEDVFLAEMRHFLACCRGEAVPPVDGTEGRRALEICLAAKRSAAEGRMVTVGHSESSGS